ncbi:MAG: hypothetical protein ACOVPB_04290 [Bacteroidia bacterium]
MRKNILYRNRIWLVAGLISITFAFILTSCREEKTEAQTKIKPVEINHFSATSNYLPEEKNEKSIQLNYQNAIDGFIIPTLKDVEGGYFKCNFQVDNSSDSSQRLYYKIYYQNSTYKFNEFDSLSGTQHQLAHENFYGSWEDIDVTFKAIDLLKPGAQVTITDSFRIVGNPRNEERYFNNGKNDRWKRNPRVGKYQFMLVVCTEKDLKLIPKEVQSIHLKKGAQFINPFYYFKFGDGKNLQETIIADDPVALKVHAKPDLGSGIYVNNESFGGQSYEKSYFCKTCGQDDNLYQNAPVQQFINYVDASTKFNNIPVVMDILKDDYSQIEYNWNKSFFAKEELIPTLIQTSKKPCQTVFSDAKEHKITIKNPGSKAGEWKKESVGIITRHGMTYGKYRVKVKLTELLNKSGVWNGLTNAIWLITQGGGEWNFRRNCNSSRGYMSTYWGGVNDKRVRAVDYSEIDFEIIKTPPYCPDNVFPPVYDHAIANSKNIKSWHVDFPDDVKASKGKVSVACTNWDMACMEPKRFTTGCNSIDYQGKTYHTFRWDSVYRALTEKQEELDDELFAGPFYYFEIDWRPTEIIWRIGASPDKMRVVGYMNEEVTSIPNNQMLLIVTQEYHNTTWWPGAPYAQDNLPFPLNDIPGEIYELVVE